MLKKYIALGLITVLTLSGLLGCTPSGKTDTTTTGGSISSDFSQNTTPSLEPATINIGVMQIVEHPSLNTIREAFMAEMDRLGYGNAKFDYQNGQGDMSLLTTIAQKFVGNKVNVIVAIATPTAVAAASATSEIPIVFSAITDPVAAKLVKDVKAPDKNITGVSDLIPVEKIFELAASLTPEAETFGFVYNLSEVNSVSVIEKAKAYCDAQGIKYIESPVANSSEVQMAAQSLVGKVDAFFTPIDNTVATAMPVFSEVALKANVPIYPGADSMVKDGGLATYGIDYEVLGQKTAEMVVAILEGKPVAELPVVRMENFRIIINQKTAEALGIDYSTISDAEIFKGE